MTGQPFFGAFPFGSETTPETVIALPSTPTERYLMRRFLPAAVSAGSPVILLELRSWPWLGVAAPATPGATATASSGRTNVKWRIACHYPPRLGFDLGEGLCSWRHLRVARAGCRACSGCRSRSLEGDGPQFGAAL